MQQGVVAKSQLFSEAHRDVLCVCSHGGLELLPGLFYLACSSLVIADCPAPSVARGVPPFLGPGNVFYNLPKFSVFFPPLNSVFSIIILILGVKIQHFFS